MAKQSRLHPTTFEPLANLRRKYSEAVRKRVFAEWNSNLKEKPKTRELRNICLLLIDNPDLIYGPYAPYIYLILQGWLAKTKAPKRPHTGKEIADLVDLVDRVIDAETPPGKALATKARNKLITKARKKVAESLCMTVEAVKQNHLRHGKSKRDKSR